MKGVLLLFSIVLIVAWIGAANAAGLFPFGPKPSIPGTLRGSVKSEEAAKEKRSAYNYNEQHFRNSWVVEFNDLITSSTEEFAEQHNVIVRRIGKTDKFSVKQKHATYGLDTEKQVS